MGRSARLVRRGPIGTVEYAVRWDRTSESRQWLESLPLNQQARFDVLFEKVLLSRTAMNRTQFRKLGDQVYEFKRYGLRLFCFMQGSRYLLTHGEKKASPRKLAAEISHCRMIADEHSQVEAAESRDRRSGRSDGGRA